MSIVGIDPSSEVSPFEQVRTQIAGHVAAGRMTAGQKLPTVRALATELGLAVNTVARAYREREADGVVATEGRRGTFVRGRRLDEVDGDVGAAAAAYAAAGRRAGLSRAEATRLVEQAWDRAGRS
jgi:DNA-binding transcriptional regulator YhcF (GntR family)